jgi:hypothetical protein
MPQQKPRGRPKLPKGSGKESRLFCRLIATEQAEIETAAREANQTKSEWIRDVLMAAARAKNPAAVDASNLNTQNAKPLGTASLVVESFPPDKV